MRITIEPTTDQVNGPFKEANCIHHKVVVEHPYDDMNIADTMQLVRRALIAYGWGEVVVNEYIPEP